MLAGPALDLLDWGSIDPVSAAYTSIGPLGFDAEYGQGLDFDDRDGTLFLAAFNNTSSAAELWSADTDASTLAFVSRLGMPGVDQFLRLVGYSGRCFAC